MPFVSDCSEPTARIPALPPALSPLDCRRLIPVQPTGTLLFFWQELNAKVDELKIKPIFEKVDGKLVIRSSFMAPMRHLVTECHCPEEKLLLVTHLVHAALHERPIPNVKATCVPSPQSYRYHFDDLAQADRWEMARELAAAMASGRPLQAAH